MRGGAELTDRRPLMVVTLLLAAGAEAQQPPLPPPGLDGTMFGVVRQSLTLWGIWDYVVFFAVAGLPVYCCCLWMSWCLCCWCWHRRGRQFAREARRFSYDYYRKAAKSREHGDDSGRRRQHEETRRRGGGGGGGGGVANRRQPDACDARHALEGGTGPNAAAGAIPRPPSGWAAIPAGAALPPGWEELIDDDSGDTYYHHIVSGATSWERPG